MGNDGGSIPTRRELVKSSARPPTTSELKATALESLTHAWAYCPLSSEPLDTNNIVSDWRGRLYNYESILQGLMPSPHHDQATGLVSVSSEKFNPEKITFASTGIKSLKDVLKLCFTKVAPPVSGTSKTLMDRDNKDQNVCVCPLSQKELGPATKAVYLVPCGHVFYDVALREVIPEGESKHICPECAESFEQEDVIPILPTDEKELIKLRKRIEKLQAEGLTHRLKRDKGLKKNKKRKHEENGRMKEKNAEKGHQKVYKLSSINDSATTSLRATVVAELEEKHKKRKLLDT